MTSPDVRADLGAAPPFSAWERSLAARYLRAKRSQGGVALISVISFIGIALGVAVLIIVMSIMNGFRSELLGSILGVNGHIYVAGPAIDPANLNTTLARVRAVPGVAQAAPLVNSQVLVEGPRAAVGAAVRGIRPEDLATTHIVSGNIRTGSLREFGVGADPGGGVVIGIRLAEALGLQAGDDITIISPAGSATPFGMVPVSKTYRILGTFEVGMSLYDSGLIYMPLAEAQALFGRGELVDEVQLQLADPEQVPELKPEIARAAGSLAFVTDWTQREQSYFGALAVERNVMRMILLLIIVVAALNIISGLVMLVKNKSRDIAILRTMGAGRGAILRIFFMSGAAIGVAGTFAGILFGVLFCLNIGTIQAFVEWVTNTQVFAADIYFLSRVPQKMELHEIVFITIFSLIASFIAALPQALHASRLDPVEALRYE